MTKTEGAIVNEDTIRMAREAGLWPSVTDTFPEEVQRFANLVAAAEREKVAQWMIQRSYATGHGDTLEDLLAELDWQIADGWNRALINGVQTEREACAKVAEKHADIHRKNKQFVYAAADDKCAYAIRARGNHD